MECLNCKETNHDPTARYCHVCGYPLNGEYEPSEGVEDVLSQIKKKWQTFKKLKCCNCNETDHEPTAKFCHVCGASLEHGLNSMKGAIIAQVVISLVEIVVLKWWCILPLIVNYILHILIRDYCKDGEFEFGKMLLWSGTLVLIVFLESLLGWWSVLLVPVSSLAWFYLVEYIAFKNNRVKKTS